jgi:hypothetical protein
LLFSEFAADRQGGDTQKPLRLGVVGYEGHGALFAKELNAGLGAKTGQRRGGGK